MFTAELIAWKRKHHFSPSEPPQWHVKKLLDPPFHHLIQVTATRRATQVAAAPLVWKFSGSQFRGLCTSPSSGPPQLWPLTGPCRHRGSWKETAAGDACWWRWIYLERNSESLTKICDKFLLVIILYLCLKVITLGCDRGVCSIQNFCFAWKASFWLWKWHIANCLYFGLHTAFPSRLWGGNQAQPSSLPAPGSSETLLSFYQTCDNSESKAGTQAPLLSWPAGGPTGRTTPPNFLEEGQKRISDLLRSLGSLWLK